MSKQYIIDRMKEPSTWRGIIRLLTACGVPIAPELAIQIMAIGMAATGIVGIFTADK